MENNLELNNIELDNTGVNTPDTVGVDANTQQTQGDKSAWDIYTKKTHVIGRTVSIITLVMLVGAPFLIGKLLGAYPDLGAAGKGFLYTPMLGAGGGYLAFITGNLINMKIPCAVNARDMVGAKTGTPENEIISTISIATSSLVTILVLALGVLLMVPLQPVLQSEVLQPAFENVVPALFGAMQKYEDRCIAADPHEPVVHPGAVTDRLHQLYDRSVRCHCHRCGISDVPEKEYAEPGTDKS